MYRERQFRCCFTCINCVTQWDNSLYCTILNRNVNWYGICDTDYTYDTRRNLKDQIELEVGD